MAHTCQACVNVKWMLGISVLCSVSFYLGSLYPVIFRMMPCSPLERVTTPAHDLGGKRQHENVLLNNVDTFTTPIATSSPSAHTHTHTPATHTSLPHRHTRRHIYLDMGANWANTLRLYESIAGVEHRNAGYEVYAFEANPFIQTYVNKFVHYLNRQGPKPPILIPPAGSNGHLRIYSRRYRCDVPDKTAMVKCMQKKFTRSLSNLPLNESLNDRDLVASRMADASRALADVSKSRFTLIPAAVGAKEGKLEMTRDGALYGIMRGGAMKMSDSQGRISVPVVDVVTWMLTHFRETDYIVMKMDAEGAEHEIFDALLALGQFAILDVLAYECHPPSSDKCKALNQRVDAAAKSAGTLVLREGKGRYAYEGIDRYSTPDQYYPLDPQ